MPAGTARGQKVRRIGVVGSGFMGAGIAGTAALTADVEVRLKDADLSRVGKGIKAATDLIDGAAQESADDAARVSADCARCSPATGDFSGFAGAQIVIEAVFEDLGVKRQVIAELEAAVPPHVIIATNTSTIPIQDIAAGARASRARSSACTSSRRSRRCRCSR